MTRERGSLEPLDPNAVHEKLTGGSPDTGPDDLSSRAEKYGKNDELFNALEAEAFGMLLNELE